MQQIHHAATGGEVPSGTIRVVSSGPTVTIDHDELSITLLGTAHVSRASAEEVTRTIETGDFDAVAVELCSGRFRALTDPEAIGRMDLVEVVRRGKGAVVVTSLALGAFQQRLAERLDVELGADMKAAISAARRRGLPLLLIDRDVGITMKRIYRALSLRRRFHLLSASLASIMSRRQVSEEEIERMKEGDALATIFDQFSRQAPELFGPLVRERDRYMVARLLELAREGGYRRVLAVVGAGHVAGMAACADRASPDHPHDPARVRLELERVPPASRGWRLLPWALVAVIVAGFVVGFWRDSEVGWQMVQQWVVINGTLAAIGAALALAHPLTVASAFLAAPLTSLNPTISAGVVSAAVESWLRKPRMADFATLRDDTASVRGWWGNRVSRTLLVFVFSGLGSVAGTYLAGYALFEAVV